MNTTPVYTTNLTDPTDPTGHNKCELGANPARWIGNGVDCLSKACVDSGPNDNCETIPEAHPEGTQQFVNGAGGLCQGLTFGACDDALDAVPFGAGSDAVEWDSYEAGYAGSVGQLLWAPVLLRSPGVYAALSNVGGVIDTVGSCWGDVWSSSCGASLLLLFGPEVATGLLPLYKGWLDFVVDSFQNELFFAQAKDEC